MNSLIKYGVIIGVISIVITAITYAAGPSMFFPMTLLMFPIGIAMYVYFGIQARKANGGYFTFGEAFKSLYMMGIIATLLSTVFGYVLFGIVDPNFFMDAQTEMAYMIGGFFGQDRDAMDAALEAQEPQLFTVGQALIQFIQTCVIGAIGALIIGAIIKKQDPETADF